MNKSEVNRTVRDLIRSGKTREVFKYLHAQSLGLNFSHSVTIIESEYNALLEQEVKGTLSRDVDSATASNNLLKKGKIAATPMINWGTAKSNDYVRLVYSNEPLGRLKGIGERLRMSFGL